MVILSVPSHSPRGSNLIVFSASLNKPVRIKLTSVSEISPRIATTNPLKSLSFTLSVFPLT